MTLDDKPATVYVRRDGDVVEHGTYDHVEPLPSGAVVARNGAIDRPTAKEYFSPMGWERIERHMDQTTPGGADHSQCGAVTVENGP